MPAPELQRRTLFFIFFATAVIIVLAGLPLLEGWLQADFLPQFGWRFVDGWQVPKEGAASGMMAETTASLLQNFFHIIKIILWMALVIAIVRYFAYLIFGGAFRGAGQSEISSLLRTVLSVIFYIVAFFIIFQSQYPGVQLAPLFTGSAILGIVVGLALQDTLGNLFAGIALQADQPFQVGDVVSITNRGNGVVESVSWRGVKIRTFQNKLLVISNAVLGKETIEVAPRGNLNARIVFFNTLYANSPARTAQVVRDAVRLVDNVSQKIRPVVRIRNLGDNGIDWEVKYWIEDYTRHNDTDADIRQRIWYAFQREKIEFAYPTRTIHVETKPQETAFDEHVNTISERLNKVAIFAPLSDEETTRLAESSKLRVYAPGEAIVRMGQEGNSMFVIIRGSVKVQVPDGSGVRTLNELRENEFFGEMSLLTGEPRTATVMAAEETEVLQIKKAAIKPIFEANPELVKTIGEMIEERREVLRSLVEKAKESEQRQDRGMLRSIRKFFGLR
jgi:small-conductance mechanosensitive channel/CRP-like cAMP-binding protein